MSPLLCVSSRTTDDTRISPPCAAAAMRDARITFLPKKLLHLVFAADEHPAGQAVEGVGVGSRSGGTDPDVGTRCARNRPQRLAGHPRPIQGDGEAEVAELRAAVAGEPDVAGLQIAVNDAATVCILECLTDLVGDAHGFIDGKGSG